MREGKRVVEIVRGTGRARAGGDGGAPGARRDVMLSHALFSGWRKRQFATISTDSQNRRLLSRRRAIKQDTRHSVTTLHLNKSLQIKHITCNLFWKWTIVYNSS